jgi:four helix bundle protein
MPLIKRFEDIQAWQRRGVDERSSTDPIAHVRRDRGLKDLIGRAAVSAMTNIAEGFDCESNAEFARFRLYRRSAVEVQSCSSRTRRWVITEDVNTTNRRAKRKPSSAL